MGNRERNGRSKTGKEGVEAKQGVILGKVPQIAASACSFLHSGMRVVLQNRPDPRQESWAFSLIDH